MVVVRSSVSPILGRTIFIDFIKLVRPPVVAKIMRIFISAGFWGTTLSRCFDSSCASRMLNVTVDGQPLAMSLVS